MYPPFFHKPGCSRESIRPDSTRLALRGLAICIFTVLVLFPGNCFAHELPDGFVERGIAIVVRRELARIEYRIGASDVTMRTQLAEWNIETEGLSEEALRQCFADSALACLPGEMRIFVDGRALEFVPVDARVGGQHHVSAVITFEVPLPDAQGLVQLRMEDHAFGGMDGAIRLAFKSTGDVMTRNSIFAPALVRADRKVLPLRLEIGRQSPIQIGARMVFSLDETGNNSAAVVGNGGFGGKLAKNWLVDDAPPDESAGQ